MSAFFRAEHLGQVLLDVLARDRVDVGGHPALDEESPEPSQRTHLGAEGVRRKVGRQDGPLEGADERVIACEGI